MDTNTTRIEGLDANTDYIVQVSATNGAGTSELSAASNVAADHDTESKNSNYTHDPLCMYGLLLAGQVDGAVVGIVVMAVITLLAVTALILNILYMQKKRKQ
jgi:hypothetical protein